MSIDREDSAKIDHPCINAAMRVERKIVSLEMLRRLVVRKIVDKDRAQDGALGLDVGRKSVRETVIGSCQGICISENSVEVKTTLQRRVLSPPELSAEQYVC